MGLEKVFKQYCALDQQGKIEEGKKAYQALRANLKVNGYDDKAADEVVWLFVRAAVGADRYGSKEEYELFVAVTGFEISAEEFAKFAKRGDKKEFADAMDSIVDSLDKRAKESILAFVACFLSVDGKLGEEEKELFRNFED